MTDYIKREDAIEALGEEPYVWSDADVEIAEHAQWVSDVKAIEAVPSADVVSAQDFRDCRNELCLKCGQYHTRHLGSCNGCRWE